MATTSLSLGPHWENFIRGEIAAGRYASASEVVRAALREYEDKRRKLDALRAHLTEGIEQANRGDFVTAAASIPSGSGRSPAPPRGPR